MIVDKNIELEIKFLREYPEWDFLPNGDLNRKAIEIYKILKLPRDFVIKSRK